MIGKLVSFAAVAAGVVGMSVAPASAAPQTTTLNAKFAGGGATLVVHPHSSWTRVNVAGLAPGKYAYRVAMYADYDHDGTGDGGYTATMCTFQVNKGQTRAATCQKSGPSIFDGFGGTPDIVQATIDKLTANAGDTVRSADFS
jgi:hypothetical protein